VDRRTGSVDPPPARPLGELAHDADLFASLRRDLIDHAARILGSAIDAEDVVQEVWFRWRQHRAEITYARAWLYTVTRNLALDRMRERSGRAYTDLDLATLADPRGEITSRTETIQDLVPGLQVIMRSLSQLERTVFVLHDGLTWTYTDIARLLNRTEQTVRQLRHRARANLASGHERFGSSPGAAAEVSRAYADVCAGADIDALLRVLAPDVPVVPAGRRLVDGRFHHDVAGIALTQQDRLLLCHRRVELPWYPDVWDLPGGHRLSGEPAVACGIRAAKRELAIHPMEPRVLSEVAGDDFSITLLHSPAWEGEPRNETPGAHVTIGFFSRDEASRLRLADRRILEIYDLVAH
jgi:RNA polymerase sigma factor (sigma-70 family)